MLDLSSLKLVIWDLDDTFWKGTLSEGGVIPIPENNDLLISLSEHGVINTICSKNDFSCAIKKLEALGVAQWFVFNSIDWTPKGTRIGKILKRIGLRPENCLFIDDNPFNLAEASSSMPELHVATPSILPEIRAYFDSVPANDLKFTRLNHYRVLEKRRLAEDSATDNTSFLFDAGITVRIGEDCLAHKERIQELILRTNQLNFTKWRCSERDLEDLLVDKRSRCGYVCVSDKYGDYGLSGFFALNQGRLVHFLFSCRILGLGVEQYVYQYLGYPTLIVNGDVSSQVNDGPAPKWINSTYDAKTQKKEASSKKVIFKGNCELKQMSWYLDTTGVKEEFAYVNDRGQNIEFAIHSVNYLSFPFLSQSQKDLILNECSFADTNMFDSEMYSPDVALVLLSTMPEANLGVYQHKTSKIKIAFGEALFPLTDPKNWDGYIRGELFTSGNVFTQEWLNRFSNEWVSLGALSPDEIEDNAHTLLKQISPMAKVCYILGSETPFLGNKQPNYEGRHLLHAEINRRMRSLAERENRVFLIDVNDYIRGQRDFTNNINHFQRRIYYEMALKANAIIAECTGAPVSEKGRFYLWSRILADLLERSGFFSSRLYNITRRVLMKR